MSGQTQVNWNLNVHDAKHMRANTPLHTHTLTIILRTLTIIFWESTNNSDRCGF